MRINKFIVLMLFFASISFAQQEISQLAGKPGAFSRMGFGARGISMGNSLSSVTMGNLVGFHNPAISIYQEQNSFHSGYSFLALDRSLNFISFTRNFTFGSKEKGNESKAGFSVGLINSGVSKIEERDDEGNLLGELSTSENLFYGSISKNFGDKLSVGLNLKFYYYSLYKEITTTSFGFDLGFLYKINPNWNLSLLITDINSSYKWNSTSLYDIYGTEETNKFPMFYKIGSSYHFEEYNLLLATEFERSNLETNYFRFGFEYNLIENMFLRGGFDRINLSNFEEPSLPSIGFGYNRQVSKLLVGFDYAFVYDAVTISDRHILGIMLNF